MLKNVLTKTTRAILFLLLAAFLFLRISLYFRPEYLHPVYREPKNTLDAVMIGSSSWYTFWAPMEAYRQVGITTFDYAQGGMPADCIEYCIKEVVKKQHPKVIAIDARTFLYRQEHTLQKDESGKPYMSESALRMVSDTMPYSVNRFRMLFSMRRYLKDAPSKYLDLLFYHDRWEDVLKKSGKELTAKPDRDYTKGFDIHLNATPFEKPEMYLDTEEIEILELGSGDILRHLCEYCDKQDFQTLIVALPVADYSAQQQKQYNYMQQIIDEYDNVRFLNTNRLTEHIGLDFSTDFLDSTHGNYSGMLKFTSFLTRILTEDYGLPDHRGQEGYAHWDEDFVSWKRLLGWLGIEEN